MANERAPLLEKQAQAKDFGMRKLINPEKNGIIDRFIAPMLRSSPSNPAPEVDKDSLVGLYKLVGLYNQYHDLPFSSPPELEINDSQITDDASDTASLADSHASGSYTSGSLPDLGEGKNDNANFARFLRDELSEDKKLPPEKVSIFVNLISQLLPNPDFQKFLLQEILAPAQAGAATSRIGDAEQATTPTPEVSWKEYYADNIKLLLIIVPFASILTYLATISIIAFSDSTLRDNQELSFLAQISEWFKNVFLGQIVYHGTNVANIFFQDEIGFTEVFTKTIGELEVVHAQTNSLMATLFTFITRTFGTWAAVEINLRSFALGFLKLLEDEPDPVLKKKGMFNAFLQPFSAATYFVDFFRMMFMYFVFKIVASKLSFMSDWTKMQFTAPWNYARGAYTTDIASDRNLQNILQELNQLVTSSSAGSEIKPLSNHATWVLLAHLAEDEHFSRFVHSQLPKDENAPTTEWGFWSWFNCICINMACAWALSPIGLLGISDNLVAGLLGWIGSTTIMLIKSLQNNLDKSPTHLIKHTLVDATKSLKGFLMLLFKIVCLVSFQGTLAAAHKYADQRGSSVGFTAFYAASVAACTAVGNITVGGSGFSLMYDLLAKVLVAIGDMISWVDKKILMSPTERTELEKTNAELKIMYDEVKNLVETIGLKLPKEVKPTYTSRFWKSTEWFGQTAKDGATWVGHSAQAVRDSIRGRPPRNTNSNPPSPEPTPETPLLK